jgi:antitoxin PrlF
MKATLAISNRGVLTLPAKLREAVGLRPDDPVIAEVTAEGLLLRPAVTLPVEVYSEARVREFDKAEADLGQLLKKKRRA